MSRHILGSYHHAAAGPFRHSSALRVATVTAAGCAVAAVLRRRFLRWGATDDEVSITLAGDTFVPHPDVTATRAITIRADADAVWPWIAQLGQGRGGFYSYDVLENLVGCDIHSADHIVPDWQNLHVGTEVKLAPELALRVAFVEPGRAMVLRGGIPLGRAAAPYEFTWAFVLLDEADATTRLVVRERYGYTRRWAALIVEPAALVSFVMSTRMLRGIKHRAEHRVVATSGDAGQGGLDGVAVEAG